MTGKELNKWRKRMGFTLAKMSEEMGIPKGTAHQWIYSAGRPIPAWVDKFTAAIERIRSMTAAQASTEPCSKSAQAKILRS